jgi:hypothetical protein
MYRWTEVEDVHFLHVQHTHAIIVPTRTQEYACDVFFEDERRTSTATNVSALKLWAQQQIILKRFGMWQQDTQQTVDDTTLAEHLPPAVLKLTTPTTTLINIVRLLSALADVYPTTEFHLKIEDDAPMIELVIHGMPENDRNDLQELIQGLA